VTVFRPEKEAEVIIIKHVTEIYGREDGWDVLSDFTFFWGSSGF
jgi:hypothetical protein